MAKAGLCTIACRETSIFEAIDAAKSIDAEGIEIWGKPGHISYPVKKTDLLKIKEYAESKGIPICAFGSYFRAGTKTIINNVELTVENQIEIARLIDTGIIRIWAGDKNFSECTEDEIEIIINEIKSFGECAAEENIIVVLERHSGTLTNQWENVELILEKINSDNIFLNYQIPHPATGEKYRTESISDYKCLLKYSKHAHLQNYSRGDTTKRTFLDSGIVDYSELEEAAKDAEYDGYFMVEFSAETNDGLNKLDSLRRDIKFIKNI